MSQGALPTTKDKKGLTPLHYAASHGHKDVSGSSSSTCSDRSNVTFGMCARGSAFLWLLQTSPLGSNRLRATRSNSR